MSPPRILVTGHLGFIGSNFCRLFANRYSFVGIDYRGWGSLPRNLEPGVEDLNVDLADETRVREALARFRFDAIVHFAAESHVDRSIQDDRHFWSSNVYGTRTLAKLAGERKVRLVHVSTDEVYGDALESQAAWTEASATRPQNPYSVTKAAAEMMLLAYRRATPFDLVITRGANTIGPRQFPEKALPKAVDSFAKGRSFPLYRTPARRMWLYVDDHCRGVHAALEKGVSGEIYNIGPRPENEVYTHEVIEHVRKRVGRGNVQEVEDRKGYDLRYWMDSSKAKRELGWEAEVAWQAAVDRSVDWYLANPDWLAEAGRRSD
jgi:dTDP-glucose 4,6-dehydratase